MSEKHESDAEHEDELFDMYGRSSQLPTGGKHTDSCPHHSGAEEPDGWTSEQRQAVLAKALGGLDPSCPVCEVFCPHREIEVRDAFMRRAQELAIQLIKGTSLFQQAREFGIERPTEIGARIYDTWGELSVLYDLAEPLLDGEDELEAEVAEVLRHIAESEAEDDDEDEA